MAPKGRVMQSFDADVRKAKITMQYALVFVLTTCLVLLAQPARAHWCETSKQSTPIERAICNDDGLLNADIELNYLYSTLGGSQNSDLQLTQRSWLKARNGCTNMNCLRLFYQDRLRVLRALAGVTASPAEPAPPAEPARPARRQNDSQPNKKDQDELPDIQPF
ncbi:MAG: lysozyme inhibitor LprI family protein [Hyphomicrobiaceae bacterium]